LPLMRTGSAVVREMKNPAMTAGAFTVHRPL